MSNGLPGVDFGPNWTRLTRNVIVTLFVIYVVQLLSRSSGIVEQLFAWHPFGEGFRPWQVLTAFLLGDSTPFYVVLEWLAIFFFLAPVEGMLGTKRLFRAVGTSWVVAVVVASILMATGLIVPHTYMGIAPLVTALVALFGFVMPFATVRLFFVLPVRAVWFAWGSGLLTFLYFLFMPALGSALAFFAWTGAAAYMAIENGALRRLGLRWKKRQIERKLSRFEVIEGGRMSERKKRAPGEAGRDDWIH